METANGPDHADTATLLHNLAVACKMQGRLDEAIQHYRRALNIREAALPGSSPALAKSQSSLAVALCMAKRYEQAEQLFRDALAFEQGYAAQNPTGEAGTSLRSGSQGFLPVKTPSRLSVLPVRLALPAGQACRSLGNTAAGLADCLVALRRYSDAVPLYSQAAECRESILGLDHPQVPLPPRVAQSSPTG